METERKILKAPIYVYSLGGLGEVGKNMYVIEQNESCWIIDCGILFGELNDIGVNGTINSWDSLSKKRINGIIITHGHEDHIGGIPYFLMSRREKINIYASKMTKAIIAEKLSSWKIWSRYKLITIDTEYLIDDKKNDMQITFYSNNHSIPDSLGIHFKTNQGNILSTGDFKIDTTPMGNSTEWSKLTKYRNEGIDLFMSDSTNSFVKDISKSELYISKEIDKIVRENKGKRIIFTTFASNVYRVASIVNAAMKNDRVVVPLGRTIERGILISRRLKYINIPDDRIILNQREVRNIDPKETIFICTGSQGNENSAMMKIATKKSKILKLQKDDVVVFSSSVIPGNTKNVERVKNGILKIGAKIITNADRDIHSSGHGNKYDQQLMLNLINPKFFMPIHGERTMLEEHKKTAITTGVSKDNIIICKNGDVVKMLNGVVKKTNDLNIVARDIYVSGKISNSSSTSIINERINLGKNGVVFLSAEVIPSQNKISDNLQLTQIGILPFSKQTNLVMEEAKNYILEKNADWYANSNLINYKNIKINLTEVASDFFLEKLGYKTNIIVGLIRENEN